VIESKASPGSKAAGGSGKAAGAVVGADSYLAMEEERKKILRGLAKVGCRPIRALTSVACVQELTLQVCPEAKAKPVAHESKSKRCARVRL
jgi:hypothetical protein